MESVERAAELLADRPASLATGFWLDATPPIGWWQRHDGSGGQFVEQAAHIVDLARLLVGEIDEVFGYTARTSGAAYPEMDTAEVTAVSAHFSAGAVGSFTSTCLLGWPHRIGLNLFGDGIALELSESELRITSGRAGAWCLRTETRLSGRTARSSTPSKGALTAPARRMPRRCGRTG